MTTDLHRLGEMPKLRLHAVDSHPSLELSVCASSTSPGRNSDGVSPDHHREDEEMMCRTPTSEGNIIPAILTCPPAPKKPRIAPSCKRKLSELDFFEILNRTEIDELFRPVSARIDSEESPKRKRVSKRIAA
ncbi:hypothetical protein SAY86_007820 [Trapa natans]|uniref:Cyclin-dependent protein kinase inhibitor SMR1 n=1 Tax=Trapa natans TaxID=22666 RepID=A0AAN7LCA5_TRANT|nr:hypothetical protein SAY86_007820 [Trapa natans]